MVKENILLSIICIFIFGGLGGMFRFFLSQKFDKKNFPYGTLLANITAVFILSASCAFLDWNKPIFIISIVASFATALSTFSALALQLDKFFEEKKYKTALVYCLLTIFSGLIICAIVCLVAHKDGF